MKKFIFLIVFFMLCCTTNAMTLTWDVPAEPISGIRVYSSVNSGEYTIGTGYIAQSDGSVNFIEVPNPTEKTYYVVTALNEWDESTPSNEVMTSPVNSLDGLKIKVTVEVNIP